MADVDDQDDQDEDQGTPPTAAPARTQALPIPAAAPAAPAPTQTQQTQSQPAPAQTMQPAYGPAAPAYGARGQPPVALQTAQSEPTPAVKTPPFDSRPYAWVSQHDPRIKGYIDDAASLTGVDPDRIAWHAYKESGFQRNDANGRPVRGSSGEIGMMQLMPGTVRQLDPTGRYDSFDERDNILLGAQYIAQQDGRFGKNSPSSFAAYNGGPGGVKGDKAQAYARSAFPTTNLGSKDFVGQGSATPRGLVDAGTQGGPDGFLRYAVNTAPAGMPMTDAWRHAEELLVSSFLERGDLTGAQHAQDWVAQMSHVGSNQYLMAAYQSLQAGDGVGASQYLAKAHAFFPDGTIGRFRSDGQHVYAERLDEHDPSRRVGSPFMITPNDVAGLLNQTTDPGKFLSTLRAEQLSVAQTRLAEEHGKYYQQLPALRAYEADTRADTAIQNANTRADTAIQAANIRADNAETVAGIRANKQAGQAANARAIDKETDTKFNNLMTPQNDGESNGAYQARLGDMAEVYSDVRRTGNGDQGLSPPQAERVTRGLSDRTLSLIRQTDGQYRVVDPNDKSAHPIAYISKAMGDRLAGATAPSTDQQRSPIGSGPTTDFGRGAMLSSGITNNLSGTVNPQQQQAPVSQSSALPVQ